jgi:hypothetical protein
LLGIAHTTLSRYSSQKFVNEGLHGVAKYIAGILGRTPHPGTKRRHQEDGPLSRTKRTDVQIAMTLELGMSELHVLFFFLSWTLCYQECNAYTKLFV